jgi:hypothetical protein
MNIKNAMAAFGGALVVGVLGFSGQASAQADSAEKGYVILNEYNAVGPTKYLTGGTVNTDTTFGVVQGNGGEWLELVVTNTVNLQGFTIEWDNDDGSNPHGSLTFTSHALWSNVKAGTIITIRLDDDDEDYSYSPCSAPVDLWIRVDASNPTYITSSGTTFKTDNDGWRARILDAGGDLVQPWVGESANNGTLLGIWNGSGLGSDEVGKLEANPSTAAANRSPMPNYQDGTCSTFGHPNCWSTDGGAGSQVLPTPVCP